ncbi:MAG: glutamine-hydrolyzing carbamoyl-phosphate synthase small subunit [Candidatus Doudnabacteria bacterium]|nr:glutamine-hydrolyzing carbamoyl-phosphate synthase small subunit [Candidatus Doudnabacteria bacterium]
MRDEMLLKLKDGAEFRGRSFGAEKSISGEVVFVTGMVGYPEALTDPSFRGQILVFTYPLIGNYGVPDKRFWESKKIQVSGLIVSTYNSTPSHWQSKQTLSQWLKKEGVPALEVKDTRGLTLKLRTQGVMLGKIDFTESGAGRKSGKDIGSVFRKDNFEDPNLRNLVAEVSIKKPQIIGSGKTTVALIDCGAKANIARSLAKRGLKVVIVPWNFNPLKLKQKISGVVISNGPGDPQMAGETVANVKALMNKKLPILGICLGNQILALAAGGTTFKLKFGHRGQNQPCVLSGTNRCVLTTQNHGFAVGKIPKGFKEWFYNANDNTNEGIIHRKLPLMSVQFHPEAAPGPTDADWIFDEFVKTLK